MEKTEVKELLSQSNILTELTEEAYPAFKKKGLDFGFSGNCTIDGVSLKILAGFSQHFPRHKPVYFLLNPEEIDYIPHIETDGTICYTHDENLVMDIDNPTGIIQGTFSLAAKTLQDGIRKENHHDFLNEFEAYWGRIQDAIPIFTNVEIKYIVEVVKIGKNKSKDSKKELLFAVSDSQERINSIGRFVHSESSPPLQNGVYIPLEKGSSILIPRPKTQLTLEFVRNMIFDNLSTANQKKLQEILNKKTKIEDFLIISFPQPNGNHAFLGVRITGINYTKHPLLVTNGGIKIRPLAVRRLDKEYMLERGGNGLNFTNNRVLLIGAGAVGGYIAEELVKSSIIKVDIADPEDLEIENCYRHSCGFGYLNENKAKAVKLKLEEFYPHSEIEAYPDLIEDLIAKRKLDFKKYDAIVVATGNATINMYLTKYFREINLKAPIIFAWLDSYGIGGHCLITNVTDKGCYSCLYSNDKLCNIASFANSDQPKPFLKTISGCGSVYSPYSSVDACQTALMTVRKVISVFGGKESENAIYSWKGNSEQFLKEGFKVSERYSQTDEALETNKSLFHTPNCESCGNKKSNI